MICILSPKQDALRMFLQSMIPSARNILEEQNVGVAGSRAQNALSLCVFIENLTVSKSTYLPASKSFIHEFRPISLPPVWLTAYLPLSLPPIPPFLSSPISVPAYLPNVMFPNIFKTTSRSDRRRESKKRVSVQGIVLIIINSSALVLVRISENGWKLHRNTNRMIAQRCSLVSMGSC